MADEQRCVDEIRFHLQASYCELTDELRQLATQYTESCHEANRRLQRCSDYLRQGLRSEAIHAAEAEPNLLDMIATLDFTEREQWIEILEQYELPRCEPLMLDVAEALNEAYAAEQPLAGLLRQHRRLVLLGAPLEKRLGVMRRLGDLDQESTHWDDDIRTFEQARFLEIEEQAREAARNRNTTRLKELARELTAPEWRMDPPAALKNRIRKAAGRAAHSEARQELIPLTKQLDETLATFNLAEGRKLAKRWKELAAQVGLSENDELYELASPVLGWIEDEDAQENAEAEWQQGLQLLEQALDDQGTTDAEFERLEVRLLRAERPLPELLETRLRNRRHLLAVAHQRRRLLLGGTVAVAVLLIGSFAGVMGYRDLEAREVERLAVGIEQLLENHELEEARQLFEEHAEISTAERWVDLRTRLVAAETDEQKRLNQLAALMATAAETASHDQAVLSLKQAAGLARTSEEQLKVVALQDVRRKQHEQKVAKREEQFRTRLATAASGISELEQAHTKDAEDQSIDRELVALTKEIATLAVEASNVRPELGGQVKLLSGRLASLEKSRQTYHTHSGLVARLTAGALVRQIGMNDEQPLAGFREALQAYVEQFPDHSGSPDLKKSATEVSLWEGELAGAALLAGWRSSMPAEIEQVRSRIEQCEQFLKQHPRVPVVSTVGEYAGWLKSIRRRVEDADGDADAGIRPRLEQLFGGDLMTGLHVLETKEGEVFYITKSEDFTGKVNASFQYVSGFSGETQGKSIVPSKLVSLVSRPAPQTAVAQQVLKELPRIALEEWDSYLEKLASRILADRGMNPFLRYYLLRITLEQAAGSNVFLERELKPVLDLLDDDEIDLAAAWIDPLNRQAADSSKRAEQVIKKLPSLPDCWKRARDSEAELVQSLRSGWIVVGWIDRDSETGWFCRSHWEPEGRHELRVIYSSSAEGPTAWRRVGHVADGALHLQSMAGQWLRQGSLVAAWPADIVEPRAAESSTTASGRGNSQ